MDRLAILSFHTSPLLQPGVGDSGGMNVYVRELAAALARTGVACDVFTRRTNQFDPDTVAVEPNFVVHNVISGPPEMLPLESLPPLVDEFTAGVLRQMTGPGGLPLTHEQGGRYEAIHANYWLSAIAGHSIKHELNLPLVTTFHTLDRVKAESTERERAAHLMTARAEAEAATIGCADGILASCDVEALQIETLYNADPSRISVIAPAIDHAFFAPGDQRAARAAIKVDPAELVLLFVGRIQPLKRVDVAVATLLRLRERGKRARLIICGGPSGPEGDESMSSLVDLVDKAGLCDAVTFVAPQPHHLLSTYYRAADVVLVPSRSESFGLVALEAAACGTPVVASSVGGLTTVVDDAVTGFLIELPDPDRYADAVLAITDDPIRRADMAEAAAKKAANYTWRGAAFELRSVFDHLVASNLVTC